MQLKHTNSPIAFLCPYHQCEFLPLQGEIHGGDEVDLTSNWWESIIFIRERQFLSVLTASIDTIVILASKQGFRPTDFVISAQSVFKTLLRCPWRWGNTCSHSEHRSQAQQRRLYCHKWETSTVPNYKRSFRIGGFFSFGDYVWIHLVARVYC